MRSHFSSFISLGNKPEYPLRTNADKEVIKSAFRLYKFTGKAATELGSMYDFSHVNAGMLKG
jgi:hypothetical protein